jgi:hypothetical protein
LLVSDCYCLDVSLSKKIQDYKEQDFGQQLEGSKESVARPY